MVLSRPDGAFCFVQRDDLAQSLSKCLSGFTHFVILPVVTLTDKALRPHLQTANASEAGVGGVRNLGGLAGLLMRDLGGLVGSMMRYLGGLVGLLMRDLGGLVGLLMRDLGGLVG